MSKFVNWDLNDILTETNYLPFLCDQGCASSSATIGFPVEEQKILIETKSESCFKCFQDLSECDIDHDEEVPLDLSQCDDAKVKLASNFFLHCLHCRYQGIDIA